MLGPAGLKRLFTFDGSGNLQVNVAAGGAGGGAVTVADGADTAEGTTTDAGVTSDANGTISAKLRGQIILLLRAFALGTPLRIDPVGSTTQPVSGVGAAGASVSGNPFRQGALGRTTLPTAVSSAQLVDLLAGRYGRQYRIAPVTSNASSAGTPITTNTNTSIVAAPGANTHLRIHRLWAQNSGTAATWAYWGNGSGVKTVPFYLAAGQPMMMSLSGSWELSTNTALFLNTATTACNIEWYVEYESLAD